MLEKQIEKNHEYIIENCFGGKSYKWVSPGLNGVPDRIDLLPVRPEHRDIVAKYVVFTELKTPAGVLSRSQMRRHKELRELGYKVNVIRGDKNGKNTNKSA